MYLITLTGFILYLYDTSRFKSSKAFFYIFDTYVVLQSFKKVFCILRFLKIQFDYFNCVCVWERERCMYECGCPKRPRCWVPLELGIKLGLYKSNKCYYLLSCFSRPVFYIFPILLIRFFIIFAISYVPVNCIFKVSNSTSIIFYLEYLMYI